MFLEEHKIRVTPQRVSVYKILHDSGSHLTAEEIYSKIKEQFSRISLGTIYSILESFKNKNIISEIRINFQKSNYETNICAHHHFLCQSCGKVYDVYNAPCKAIKEQEVDGHKIKDFQGYFYGVCKGCR